MKATKSSRRKAQLTELRSRGFKSPSKTLALIKRGLKESAAGRTAPFFRLPTLAAFKRLSLTVRTKVFLEWVKTQKGPYVYLDTHNCPLARFGQAMTHDPSVVGVVHHFEVGNQGVEVFDEEAEDLLAMGRKTYVALARCLEAHLKTL